MKKEWLQPKWTFMAGAVLTLPSMYFVLSNVLYSEAGVDGLWKPIAPIFDNPANQKFGWNINLLILFGPVLAVIFNALSLVYMQFEKAGAYFRIQVFIKRKWNNISVLLLASLTLLALFGYLFFENIHAVL